jgi:thioredoxin family protein
VYPHEKVEKFVSENFVPIKIDVRKKPELMERFGALWTPTMILLDPNDTERYRFEGYLPVPDFLAHLTLGMGHIAFAMQDYEKAEWWFGQVLENFPDSEVAPEALYWRGVSRYKGSGNAGALADTAEEFSRRYEASSWAKKASVWRKAS